MKDHLTSLNKLTLLSVENQCGPLLDSLKGCTIDDEVTCRWQRAREEANKALVGVADAASTSVRG